MVESQDSIAQVLGNSQGKDTQHSSMSLVILILLHP